MAKPLSSKQLNSWKKDFSKNKSLKIVQNALCQKPLSEVAVDRTLVTKADMSFSHLLDDWKVTDQKRSGRCWAFAGMNLMRVGAMKKLKLKDFQFSQNYVFFWDKMERSNYFLERIIETGKSDIDDRTVSWLLKDPLGDGGQWNMFINIVKKHGLVPQALMPESESSSNSDTMNRSLEFKLRDGSKTLRRLVQKNKKSTEIQKTKEKILKGIYQILSTHLGTPPSEIDWQWNDKDKKFHRDGKMTPQQFAKKYVTIPYEDYVCIVNDPRPTSPYEKTFTVRYLGNVEGGDKVIYLNVDIKTMKQLAMESIIKGEPVWMGCDVGKMMQHQHGLWDKNLFDYEALYQTDFHLNKAERLLHHQTQMTHAMLFTGVDVITKNGKKIPRRWRVENSWGDGNGKKGFYLMNDNWFDEYMFEIAVPRKRLSAKLQKALKQEPIELPPWDPMGSLA